MFHFRGISRDSPKAIPAIPEEFQVSLVLFQLVGPIGTKVEIDVCIRWGCLKHASQNTGSRSGLPDEPLVDFAGRGLYNRGISYGIYANFGLPTLVSFLMGL